MEATKELLKQYNDLKVEIRELEIRIKKIESKESILEKDSVVGSSKVFPYVKRKFTIEGYNHLQEDKRYDRTVKLKELLYKRKSKCEDMKLLIEEFINNIPDSKTRRVFQYRYIDNLSWCSIARKINKSDESYPRKIIHDRYLENLN